MPALQSKPSAASRFSWLRPRRDEPRSRYVGIDIGVDDVRVVDLGAQHSDVRGSQQRKNRSLRWLGCHRFELPIDPIQAPPGDWVDRVITTIIQRLPRSVDGNQNIAAISLPLPWVHYQVVTAAELDATRAQCDAMFSSSMFASRSHLAYWPLNSKPELEPDDPMLIVATAESAACEIADAISEVGFQVEQIVPRGVALINASSDLTGCDPECVVMLNQTGGMVAMNSPDGCGLCRLLTALPNNVQAESRASGLSLAGIRPWLSEIADEILATIRYARRSRSGSEMKPVFVCGDIAALEGVDELLATRIDASVARWRYAGKARPSPCQQIDAETDQATPDFAKDAEYAVALSLAHTAVQSVSGSVAK